MSASAPTDGMTALPGDLVVAVAQFAGARAVCSASAVCSAWRAALDREAVWRELCAAEWEGKAHLDVETADDYGVASAYPSTSGLHLCEGAAAMHGAPPAKRQRTAAAGARPGVVGGSWKEWLFAARRDSARTLITPEELCSLTWAFRLRRPGEATSATDPPPPGCDEVHDFPVFSKDGTYRSNLFEDPMAWRMVPDEGADEGAVADRVLVGDYPPLVCARDPDDWCWCMSNEWVTFRSVDVDHDEVMDELRRHQEGTGGGIRLASGEYAHAPE